MVLLEMKMFFLATFIGFIIALIQTIIIKSQVKNIILTGTIAGVFSAYKFYLEPYNSALPELPVFVVVLFGGYIISKSFLAFLRFMGKLPF